ncbi:Methyltransferase type 11 [Cyanobacterium stanieri PCC 7202]|uniref:Methyltransferase type 11 n=1 Tax=Cyanobacterium stanieri (strain ATCC 29140 / PCC 7202) TaxID=292563 RepID=K9YKX9_CYASC|nr:Methyltransferase type 11 [Cyanobacterium stanieri PCC 7202]
MLENLFIFLTVTSPKIKRKLWRLWYDFLAKSYQKKDWEFMNYGFADINNQLKPLNLSAEESQNKYFIQLYQKVSSITDLKNKKVLEIGSGRGGGSFFIAKYLSPQEIIGIDISQENIALSKQLYQLPNLSYQTGDSENLPFADNFFDIILNVESSHCYGSMDKFLAEVHRVLKPNGLFSWADLRPINDLKKLEASLSKSDLILLKKENITTNVIKALELIDELKRDKINKNVPTILRHTFSEFAGVKNSKIYNGFAEGNLVYLTAILQKKDS